MKRFSLGILLLLVISGFMISCSLGSSATKDSKKTEKKTEQQASAKTEEKEKPKGPIAPPRRDVPGRIIKGELGQLYIPDFVDLEMKDTIDVLIYFHGAAWCIEQNFYDAKKNAVLFSVASKEYWDTFRDPKGIMNIIDEIKSLLKENGISEKPLGNVALASFSGGYVAVREILRHPQYLNKFSDIILADSLYGKMEGVDKMDPFAMEPFIAYARMAVEGKCSLFFSHLYPPDDQAQYRTNTTTLAAGELIETFGLEPLPDGTKTSRGSLIIYRAEKNGLHIYGYAGMTTQDHFEHFYAICDLIRKTSFMDAKVNQ